MKFTATIYGEDPRQGPERTKRGRLKAGTIDYEARDASEVLEALSRVLQGMTPDARSRVVRIVVDGESGA